MFSLHPNRLQVMHPAIVMKFTPMASVWMLGIMGLFLTGCERLGPAGTGKAAVTAFGRVDRSVDGPVPESTPHAALAKSPADVERRISLAFRGHSEHSAPSLGFDAVRLIAAHSDDEVEETAQVDEPADEDESAETEIPVMPAATGKFDGAIDLDEINLDEDAAVEPSASDWEKAEVVPTPVPQKEIVAEVVPTPLGMPERAIAEMQSARKPPITLRSRSDVVAVAPVVPGGLPITPIKNSTSEGLLDSSGLATPVSPEMTVIGETPAELNNPLRQTPLVVTDGETTIPIPFVGGPVLGTLGTAGGVVADGLTADGPVDYKSWAKPNVTLFITGQQNGYIEPCGCTGLDKQKGGVARRMTFANQLRDAGWELLPIDAGNLIRRFGRQAEIKFHRSLEALRAMGYVAVGFGPDDVRISVGDLIQEAAAEKPEDMIYASANVVLIDPSLMPSYQMIDRSGMKVAITSILDPESLESQISEEIILGNPIESAKQVITQIQAEQPDFTVLTYYGEDKAAKELVRAVPGFDLVVVAGGYGEPTYQPDDIEGTATKMILTGNKGMYVGLVGLYENEPLKYARVPLTHDFEDAPKMRQLMAEYQFQLRDLGLANLGLRPIPHPSGREFVGSETCGECHATAFAIWQGSPHFDATEHLVHPGERSDVPRHFDPECISCHVTGWNPQNYYPYKTGYLDLQADSHLHGNGCENCHGPGSAHAAAESGDEKVTDAVRDELRKAMQLPLADAREKCMECHDLDNSPDFHEEGAFDDYWSQVEHYGLD
ncbi:multiheme c-type cytochrome [Neorhodopirellula pilleata]|uniref:Cytochrome c-554 n=1 Tax=Neorhodopirellula pilleata TaxID=2714738 RepID=A0A5C6A4A3_9BACT|nr:multiheme c-type cytochrome [Neorhodopirellula pilleata]TWT94256.1 Cytochrome c-554 precursor [Neorhodopirellula pilleata]